MTLSLPTVLRDCLDREIQLTAHGNELTVDGPQEAVTAELIDALREHKPAVLIYLRTGEIILNAETATVADLQAALDFFKRTRIGNSDVVLSTNQDTLNQER